MFRAKFKVDSVVTYPLPGQTYGDPSRGVLMSPVVSGSEENKSFSKWTPCGTISLQVTNPDLFPVLDQAKGKEFFIDFTEATV